MKGFDLSGANETVRSVRSRDVGCGKRRIKLIRFYVCAKQLNHVIHYESPTFHDHSNVFLIDKKSTYAVAWSYYLFR